MFGSVNTKLIDTTDILVDVVKFAFYPSITYNVSITWPFGLSRFGINF